MVYSLDIHLITNKQAIIDAAISGQNASVFMGAN